MKMASSQRFYISIIFVSLFFSCRATDAICYYPDGVTTEPNHSPCNKTINDSSCCDPLDSCTTSGLCLGRTGFNYRGSCTDKTWTSSNCAPGCHADPFNKVAYNTFTPLWPCDAAGAPSTDYCCNSPNRNCCQIATFSYGTTSFAFKGGMDQMILELAQLSANSTTAAATVTVTATATAAATSASASKGSSSLDLPTTVGLAVGIPLGVIALGLLGFLFWRQLKKSRFPGDSHMMELDAGKPGGNPTGYYAPSSVTATSQAVEASGQPVPAKFSSWISQTSNTGYRGPEKEASERGMTRNGTNGNPNYPVGAIELI